MSYIRSWLNPECLYITEASGMIDIYHALKPPFAKSHRKDCRISLSEKLFLKACKKWNEGSDPVKIGDLLVESRWIEEKTGRFISKDELVSNRNLNPKRMIIFFRYKRDYMMLWPVTWAYITNMAVEYY